MRWDNLAVGADRTEINGVMPLPGLPGRSEQITFDTPEFRGITFFELYARSILNEVPGESSMSFRWTINPYRGCSHACVYCFARNSHTYLDMDAGADFDSKIVVKVNAAQLLAKELAAPSWHGEPIAMGTNVDPYQRAEGKYRLMRGLLDVLIEHRNPFSILTKGTLILRDVDLLEQAAEHVPVRVAVSVGTVDPTVWRSCEPGTPSPKARLGVCRTLADRGIGCSVLMAPVLPYISDSDEQLEATVAAVAAAGASSITPLALHLRPGAREWYFRWLRATHPTLVPRYERLYSRGAYVPRGYSERLTRTVDRLARRYGLREPAVATSVMNENSKRDNKFHQRF
ncbi:MAG TPA: Rv2578c family radical SAM protein, partial [Mycobacteriales bacterium]|nr:Rv2578c family radical SAM protein [Mycobacteriales bacterium]